MNELKPALWFIGIGMFLLLAFLFIAYLHNHVIVIQYQ